MATHSPIILRVNGSNDSRFVWVFFALKNLDAVTLLLAARRLQALRWLDNKAGDERRFNRTDKQAVPKIPRRLHIYCIFSV